VAAEAAEYLAENHMPVISGMAKGIEGYAQTICLKKKGYTLAFPPMTKPADFNFHKRNYLLSAWSEKLLVIEAGEKSGALITASHAKEQNREVWAAPNSIYIKESIGTNRLIEDGCRIYLNSQQLINKGVWDNGVRSDSIAVAEGEENYANDIEKAILEIIGSSPKTVEEIFLLMEKTKKR
jgi:DNA processing protein